MAYEHLHGCLEHRPREFFFEILWVLVNAVQKKDVSFFKEFARTFELMTKNDAAPETLFTPPADPEFYWLGQLRKYYEAKSNVFYPPFFSESANKILSLSRDKRPPLTLNQVGDFLQLHLGYRPSDSSISAKAKKVGIPLHKRFGKR